MKARKLKLIKRKKYRNSNMVTFEEMSPRTAEEISAYLSEYVEGITPSIVKRLWKTGELACGSTDRNHSNYFYADEYIESLMRKEDEREEKMRQLEKKHGRL